MIISCQLYWRLTFIAIGQPTNDGPLHVYTSNNNESSGVSGRTLDTVVSGGEARQKEKRKRDDNSN